MDSDSILQANMCILPAAACNAPDDLLLACRTQEALPSLVQVCERNDC